MALPVVRGYPTSAGASALAMLAFAASAALRLLAALSFFGI